MFFKVRILLRNLVLFSMILFMACKNSRIKKLETQSGRYSARVETSAGDHIERIDSDTLNFLTFPFNVAEFTNKRNQKTRVFLVGESISSGRKVDFHPFAKLTYNDGSENTVIVARPTNPNLITAPINNYFDFISIYYGVQKMIETWVTYSKGFDSLKSLNWENDSRAIEFLDS